MTLSARLTNDITVAAIKPQPDQKYHIEYKDPDHKGFYLRLSYGGSKQFFFRYKRSQKQYKIGLGRYGHVDCAEAFARWLELRKAVDRGEHPAQEVKPRKSSDPRALTLSRLFDDHYQPQYLTTLRDQRTGQVFDIHARPALGDTLAAKVSPENVRDVLLPLEQSHYHTARKLLSLLRHMYKWANSSKQGIIHCPNPCLDYELDDPPIQHSNTPETIKHAEIRKLWRHLTNTPAGRALKLQFLSGCRGDEVAGMVETELDRDAKTWRIPSNRNKGKRLHVLPLPPLAWELIGPQADNIIFPARGKTPHLTRNGMYQALRRACRNAKITEYGTHAIRRTVATLLDDMGIQGAVADRILNHAPSSLREQRYSAHKFINEKREALEALQARIEKICGLSSVAE